MMLTLAFAVQSELEDLCFAVLQPAEFRRLRHELDVLWGTGLKPSKSRRRTQLQQLSSGSGSSGSSRGADTGMPSSSSVTAGDVRGSSGSQSHSRQNGMLAAPRRLLGRAVTRERSKWVRFHSPALV